MDIAAGGSFVVEARVASEALGGEFTIGFHNADGLVTEHSTTFPATGGWQNWTTVALPEFSLPSGEHVMRFEARSDEFNVNWFEVRRDGPASIPLNGIKLGESRPQSPSATSDTFAAVACVHSDGCGGIIE